ncbi:MAG: hypothetical protein J6U97_03060 [Bacteroidaceae bacterium]|nr:hypothetical protein [Bacteroidaceae bacterium]
MKKIMMAVAMLAVVSMSVSAKKEKKAEPEILYGIKSGIITMAQQDMEDFAGFGGGMAAAFGGGDRQMEFDMSSYSQKIYFDDYGRKTATVSGYGDRMTRSIVVGEETLSINEAENTATKMPVFGGARGGAMMGGMGMGMSSSKPIDWMNLDAKTIKKNKIKELGEEEIAGKMCKKYSYRVSMMGTFMTQTIWIYQGITMKSESETDFGGMGQEVASLEENVEIPASMFEVPEGCEIREMQMGGFGGGMGGFGGMGGMDFGGMGGGFGGGMGGFGGF